MSFHPTSSAKRWVVVWAVVQSHHARPMPADRRICRAKAAENGLFGCSGVILISPKRSDAHGVLVLNEKN